MGDELCLYAGVADVRCGVVQMCILDGNAYDAKCLEAGQERDDDLDACSLLLNNKMQPLLTAGSAATHNAASKVVVQLVVCLLAGVVAFATG